MKCCKIFFIACSLFAVLLLWFVPATAQQNGVLQYVDPFIGTGKSDQYTKWGNEGGTFPGAVAPWGYMQLSPETRNTGYDYKDSAIRFFSCMQHHSGFPSGSAGSLHIMPMAGKYQKNHERYFSHHDEKAEPGYYKVQFRDDNTSVEAVASTHCGIFRFSFPPRVTPALFLDDAGDITISSGMIVQCRNMHAVIHFNTAIKDTVHVDDGYYFSFESNKNDTTVIELRMSASSVDHKSAEENLAAEVTNLSFDQVRNGTRDQWRKLISVVSVDDSSEKNKTVFYTALYHSLLLPWIISDVNGKYFGSDKLVHITKGRHEYGGFSPWDTFRSLHPLLALLFPERQSDMVLSMMDIYLQTGYLPVESMTGNHSIPILTDSYFKGIHPVDSFLLYKAMKKSIVDGPFLQGDFQLYQNGFIPYPHTESVTRTVEYTYDDWALAQYAGLVMHDDSLYIALMNRSRNYRNLYNADELSLIPRHGDVFYHGTSNAGYKEGDQWVYTLFLPHYQRDLINLVGGDERFVTMLDKELSDKRLVFDNETMFHVPYLFNSSGYPYKTMEWVLAIRQRFSNTPGGLPGNDDLGSMSSWFVWSALGLYPVCPGNPVYAVGTPLFHHLTIALAHGKQLHIDASNISAGNFYVTNIQFNGQSFNKKWMAHNELVNGGNIVFQMGNKPVNTLDQNKYILNETDSISKITFSNFSVASKTTRPDISFWVKYTINNSGGYGTAIIKILADGKLAYQKNVLVLPGASVEDSIPCRLYKMGDHKIQLDGLPSIVVKVVHAGIKNSKPVISALQATPVVIEGGNIFFHYTVKNIDGNKRTFVVPVKLDERLLMTDTVKLLPGDSSYVYHQIKASNKGFHQLSVAGKICILKVYNNAVDALVLDMPETGRNRDHLKDVSGFHNDAFLSQFGKYFELPHSASLDSNGKTITMMTWVYDTGSYKPLTELMAKGDNHVLQLAESNKLTFFAGGWGRGDCTVDLPANWRNNWHHIAGVCNGKELRVFINGALKGITPLEEMISLNVAARWTVGSNEEFPLDRTFTGDIQGVKIFAAALSDQDILNVYQKEATAAKTAR